VIVYMGLVLALRPRLAREFALYLAVFPVRPRGPPIRDPAAGLPPRRRELDPATPQSQRGLAVAVGFPYSKRRD